MEEELDSTINQELKQPAYVPIRARFYAGPASHILFDGGPTGGKGTAGYIIIDTEGKEISRVGIYLGTNLTNNEAESTALVKALRHYDDLRQKGVPNLSDNIRIFGDSALVIKWMIG